MGVPNNIQNGDVPDASLLMANFNYLADGRGIKIDTYINLKAYAVTLGSNEYFIGYATDIKQLLFYCGDTTAGDDGMMIIGGA